MNMRALKSSELSFELSKFLKSPEAIFLPDDVRKDYIHF